MKPVAPVTRQAWSRDGSMRCRGTAPARPRRRLVRGAAPAQRRRRDVAHHAPVPAAPSPGSRRAPRRARPGTCRTSSSDSVSGGSSLITSFLPAAIVITPWSRCSGITTSCGNRPSLARWIRRQFSRATRELGAPSSIPIISPLPRISLTISWRCCSSAGRRSSSAPMRAACSTRPSRSMMRMRREPRRHRQAVAAVGRLVHVASARACPRPLEDLPPRDHRGDRHVAAAERLADQHEVGLEVPNARARTSAGAAEAGLDLVGDEQRAVAAAERLRRSEVAVRRQRDHAALDRLDDEGRDVLRGAALPRGGRGRRTAPARSRAAAGRSPP